MIKRNRSPLRVPALLAASSSLIAVTLLGSAHTAHAAVITKVYNANGSVAVNLPETPSTLCDLNVAPGCTDACVVPSPGITGDPGCTGISPNNGKIVAPEDIFRVQLVDPTNAAVPATWVPNQVGDYEFIEEGCPNVAVPDPLAGGVLNPCVSDLVRFVNVNNGGVLQGEMWFISDSPIAADLAQVPALPAPLPPLISNVFGFQQETVPPSLAGNRAQIYRLVSVVGSTLVLRTNVTSDLSTVSVLSDTVQVVRDVPAMSSPAVIALAVLLLIVGGFFIVRRGSYRIG